MNKKFGIVMLSMVVALAGLTPLANAADTDSGAKKITTVKKTTKPNRSSDSSQVTHSEVARMLVNLLALARFLPANASIQETFAILLQNEIAPPNGWEADAVVTKGDLAVLIVKALKAMGDDVDFDANDTKASMNYLRQEGIPIDTIGEGVSVVDPLAQPVAANVFDPTTDPLNNQTRFSSTDEQESGADAERPSRGVEFAPTAVTPQEVATVFESVSRPSSNNRPPTVVTPGGGFLGGLLN